MSGDSHARISAAVLGFARDLALRDDAALTVAWPGRQEMDEPWHGYDGNLRDAVFLLDLKMRHLAAQPVERSAETSRARRLLTDHHAAYRDLTGALAGVSDDELDRVPAPDEWPLRTVIHHIAGAEMGFSLLIGWAVDRLHSTEERPITMPREEMEPHYATVSDDGSLAEMLGRYDALHRRVQRDFADLDDADLEALNVWWEGYEIPAWFRLLRLRSHLIEHTIQVDKTLAMLRRAPRESERLARLLHRSLAALESVLLASPADAGGELAALAAEFEAARRTMASLK